MNNNHQYFNIWNPERDYHIIGNPRNYIKKLQIKQQLLKVRIDYTKDCIKNPEYSDSAKEIYYLSELKTLIRSKKVFERQGSLLAA